MNPEGPALLIATIVTLQVCVIVGVAMEKTWAY